MKQTKAICPECGTELTITSNNNVETDASKRLTKAEAKIEALRKAGVDVSNLFAIHSSQDDGRVGCLVGGQFTVLPEDDPIFAAIRDNGVISNRKLFRRWVMSQMFHMLATGDFNKALESKGYNYQWKMIIEELHVQAKLLQHKDMENFAMRNKFFLTSELCCIADDYIRKLEKHISKLPVRHCKGVPYVRLGSKNVFCSDIKSKITLPLQRLADKITRAQTPMEEYWAVVEFYKLAKKTWMNAHIPMSTVFKGNYKGAGAYFTMRNLIMFHNVRLRSGKGRFLTEKQSLEALDKKCSECVSEPWRLLGMLKEVIAENNINISQKIAEWRK